MSDGENLLQTVKTAIQDVVAPDVRELKVRMSALEKQMDALNTRFDSLQEQMATFQRYMQEENAAHFRAILAAINQSKAETELMVFKQNMALSERITALEIKFQQQSEARAA